MQMNRYFALIVVIVLVVASSEAVAFTIPKTPAAQAPGADQYSLSFVQGAPKPCSFLEICVNATMTNSSPTRIDTTMFAVVHDTTTGANVTTSSTKPFLSATCSFAPDKATKCYVGGSIPRNATAGLFTPTSYRIDVFATTMNTTVRLSPTIQVVESVH
jgi:hypothetical protein